MIATAITLAKANSGELTSCKAELAIPERSISPGLAITVVAEMISK